jgi:hypothetical protein
MLLKEIKSIVPAVPLTFHHLNEIDTSKEFKTIKTKSNKKTATAFQMAAPFYKSISKMI